MDIIRLASLTLAAIFVVSLSVASVAIAAPEFKPSTKQAFTSTGDGAVELAAVGLTVTCQKSNSTGEITSATLAGNVIVHFLECTGKEGEKASCPVMSTGAPLENLIITTTLRGELGLVLPKPASGSDVGLLLSPVNGKRFVTLLAAGCIPETTVTGLVAGLVSPVGSQTLVGELNFGVTGSKQNITDIDLSVGDLVAPALNFFGSSGTEQTLQLLKFEKDLEVT